MAPKYRPPMYMAPYRVLIYRVSTYGPPICRGLYTGGRVGSLDSRTKA